MKRRNSIDDEDASRLRDILLTELDDNRGMVVQALWGPERPAWHLLQDEGFVFIGLRRGPKVREVLNLAFSAVGKMKPPFFWDARERFPDKNAVIQWMLGAGPEGYILIEEIRSDEGIGVVCEDHRLYDRLGEMQYSRVYMKRFAPELRRNSIDDEIRDRIEQLPVKRKRSNAEEDMRALERRAREGDVEAGIRLARMHERVGGLPPRSAFSVEDLDQSLRTIIRNQIKTKAITQYLGDIRELASWGGRSVRHGLYDVVDDVYGGIMIQNHRQAREAQAVTCVVTGGQPEDLVTVGIGFAKFHEVLAKFEKYKIKYPVKQGSDDNRNVTFLNTASTFDPWSTDASNLPEEIMAWGVAFADDRVMTTAKVLNAWRKKHKYRRTRSGFIYGEAEGGPIPREQGDSQAFLNTFNQRQEEAEADMAERWRRFDEARAAGLWPVMEQPSPSGETRRETFERWLREGRAIGVYENQDLSSSNVGGLSFAPVDPTSPPQQLGWRSTLRSAETTLDQFRFI